MLDKISEKILKCAINKCKGNPVAEVKICRKDFLPQIPNCIINSVCHDLVQKGYITPFYESWNEDDNVTLSLTYKGYSYFEYKKLERMYAFKKSVFIPIVVTLLTQALWSFLKTYSPQILAFLKTLFENAH